MDSLYYICEDSKELYYTYTYFYDEKGYNNISYNFSRYIINELENYRYPMIVEICEKTKRIDVYGYWFFQFRGNGGIPAKILMRKEKLKKII